MGVIKVLPTLNITTENESLLLSSLLKKQAILRDKPLTEVELEALKELKTKSK